LSDEIDLIKRKKLLEFQKKMLKKKFQQKNVKRTLSPREFLDMYLTEGGREMLKRGFQQYPGVAQYVVNGLVRLIISKRITGKIDEHLIYGIFYELGYPIRLETKIMYKSKGKAKSISEVLKERLESSH